MTKPRGFYCEHFIEEYKVCKNKAKYTYSPTPGGMKFLCGVHAKHLLGSKNLTELNIKNDETQKNKEKLIPVKGLDFTSMDQICLAAIVKKYCNGSAELTTEELGNVKGLQYWVEEGIFQIKGE